MTDRFMNKLNQSPYTFSTLMNIVLIIITISLLILWEENVVWLLITTHFVLIILMVFNFVLMAIFTHKEYVTSSALNAHLTNCNLCRRINFPYALLKRSKVSDSLSALQFSQDSVTKTKSYFLCRTSAHL